MDDETQFCLKWHNHQSTLIRNFDTLLESGTLVDCTLAAEGRYLKAHKVVLSACSPYFEGLLSEHYDKHPVFILKDVKFVELKAMMDYMYRGEVNISQNQLTALLKAAESLQIKGLSDSKTTGSSNNSTVAGRVEPKSTATSTSNAVTTAVDIPQGSSGLTIEKNNKVPRQRLTQTSANMSEGGASPQQVRGISSREGSVSPTRKRRARRRSLGNDESNSMENHEASNSSDVTASATVMAAPTVEDKSHAESADPIGRSALMQQLTKSNDDMLQMQMEKPEPTEDMIQPKSEYMEDQESVEDLTHLDDDMNDLNEMEQDNSRAGPSHDSSHPGLASWHITSDRSNAGVGAAGGAQGADDAVFMNAHETNAAQRDSQVTIVAIEDKNDGVIEINNYDKPSSAKIDVEAAKPEKARVNLNTFLDPRLLMESLHSDYQCNNCPKKFKTKSLIREHLKYCCKYLDYQCPYCDFRMDEFSPKLLQHMKAEHPNQRLHGLVNYENSTNSKNPFTIHSRGRYSCSFCPSRYKELRNLKHHLKVMCRKKKVCLICGMFFSEINHVEQHAKESHK
ncbi:longitudinals lacking protein, isoforms H/M/V isoform X8 [Trichogramma pretiosum]|uniref:longitudinals lacking protein, isoforms H/M/V isoform X8 n=1 Tax=Trichogramma pretiosum TaxID=7493 RepID=UPI0006C99923|nr:longitudinals lacking protein, isoforms H/M/V isoform X8 [Trichogramma pretiosum]